MNSNSLRFTATLTLGLALNFATPMTSSSATLNRTAYHGWAEAYTLANGTVEVVVVPAIGRILRFAFVGEENVLWENPALAGQTVSPDLAAWRTKDWVNFGGDKAWPSPEGSWTSWTKRESWRPPPAFDGLAHQARVDGDVLVLQSPEDPFLKTLVTRRIELSSGNTLRVTTTFEKRGGDPIKAGIWVVTQLNEPERLFAPVPPKSIFVRNYILLSPRTPPSLKVENGSVSLARDGQGSYKIGLDAETLLWVGTNYGLRIDHPRQRGTSYPDRGSSTEIYTNPDPLRYVELECLSPLQDLKAGDKSSQTLTYHLFRRTQPTPEAEAQIMMTPR